MILKLPLVWLLVVLDLAVVRLPRYAVSARQYGELAFEGGFPGELNGFFRVQSRFELELVDLGKFFGQAPLLLRWVRLRGGAGGVQGGRSVWSVNALSP